MKTINSIVVFDNDRYLLALLNGYCYANNIAIIPAKFDMEAIKQIEQLVPAIVVVPVSLLNAKDKSLEAALLRRVTSHDEVKTFGLVKNRNDVNTSSVTGWLDVVINNPQDITEFDEYINKIKLLINNLNERRAQKERRCYERRSLSGRRITEFSQNYLNRFPGHGNHRIDTSGHSGCLQPDGLQIDHRKKCLFVKGQKVDLTPKEFELVELLATDVERIFTAEEIIQHLWPASDRATKSDLYQYMHLLRKKIEQDPDHPQWIMTVKGFGYKLNLIGQNKIAFQH